MEGIAGIFEVHRGVFQARILFKNSSKPTEFFWRGCHEDVRAMLIMLYPLVEIKPPREFLVRLEYARMVNSHQTPERLSDEDIEQMVNEAVKASKELEQKIEKHKEEFNDLLSSKHLES